MDLFVADAFTTERFSGNQAGVALLGAEEDFPEEGAMRALAGELKHSETVFIRALPGGGFQSRYFTPEDEVDLCGHATIAAFTVLREEGAVSPGAHHLSTRAGELEIQVGPDTVWMDMAPPAVVRGFSPDECAPLYAAYGLDPSDRPEDMSPKAVSTGLCDILLPVRTRAALDRARQDEAAVTELSRRYGVVGFHMFWPSLLPGETAHCRNFAPLYAIPEEAATGTSNGALTYYLYDCGKLSPGAEARFIQGERMGKPSEILSRLTCEDGRVHIRVGGRAVVTMQILLR